MVICCSRRSIARLAYSRNALWWSQILVRPYSKTKSLAIWGIQIRLSSTTFYCFGFFFFSHSLEQERQALPNGFPLRLGTLRTSTIPATTCGDWVWSSITSPIADSLGNIRGTIKLCSKVFPLASLGHSLAHCGDEIKFGPITFPLEPPISPEAKSIIELLLDHDPQKRPTTRYAKKCR